jgi:hypothetical protein
MKKMAALLAISICVLSVWAQTAGTQNPGSQNTAEGTTQIDPKDDPAYKVPWDALKIDVTSREITPPTYAGRTAAKATLTFLYFPYNAEARIVYSCPATVFQKEDAMRLAQVRAYEFIKKTQAEYDTLSKNPAFYHFRFTAVNLTQHFEEEVTLGGQQRNVQKTNYTMYVNFFE